MHQSHGLQHSMSEDHGSMVMSSNHNNLPLGCERISGEENIIVSAGQRYAKDIPGTIYGMNQHEWDVDPCTRVTVTFINEDDVRHQWMVHGLPKYLYPAGMFHIEAMGGKTTTGTFIVPSENRNYLVHPLVFYYRSSSSKQNQSLRLGIQIFVVLYYLSV